MLFFVSLYVHIDFFEILLEYVLNLLPLLKTNEKHKFFIRRYENRDAG